MARRGWGRRAQWCLPGASCGVFAGRHERDGATAGANHRFECQNPSHRSCSTSWTFRGSAIESKPCAFHAERLLRGDARHDSEIRTNGGENALRTRKLRDRQLNIAPHRHRAAVDGLESCEVKAVELSTRCRPSGNHGGRTECVVQGKRFVRRARRRSSSPRRTHANTLHG
jgi:hypothetical protein